MDELLKEIEATSEGLIRGFTFQEFLLSVVLSVVLSMVLATVYRATHSGMSYSRSFIISMVIMSVTISFIMLIIGSNLARAFSLVGALSIIRFRNAVKDTRDTAYIFLVIAIGMACGTKLYTMAVVFTVLTSALLLCLDLIAFGSVGREERLLRFAFSPDEDYGGALEKELNGISKGRYHLLSSELVGDKKVLVYSVELPRRQMRDVILDRFRGAFGALDVKMLTGVEKFNI